MHPIQIEMFAREKLADRLRAAERARSIAEAQSSSARRGETAELRRAEVPAGGRPVPAHAREEAV
ncbi:MAG TPA: hypothetical protein VE644_08365 [Gaiellaceae bacterium]|nr:hypothetical protein [Gaiellaceae bacterium]